MFNLSIALKSQSASFRDPLFQNFHKSLTLPPPTTLIGIAGAAMGLSPKMAQDFFDEFDFQCGAQGTHDGKVSDLWKYNKRTKNLHLYHPDWENGGLLKREYLIDYTLTICYATNNEEAFNKIHNGFISPYFALTLGNSDSLAKISKVTTDLEIAETNTFNHCIIGGNVIDRVMKKASTNCSFSIYSSSEPITYDLPVRFKYTKDYGKRSIAEVSTFSFISNEMKLNYPIASVKYNGNNIPLFKL